LGVKNLKITLRNRSNVTIQSASVTVSYYDENNQLLEKKLIYFSNVAPKGRATMAAPDSKFADHVEYKLTTIAGKEDRYASN
ncbi:MAG: FxLYD domain-containing protein, partial [Flavisolibacter sp.]